MPIRKQVYDLTQQDLLDHPVWEFALDEEGEEGQDEATVRPLDADGAVDVSASSVIVRGEFQLEDGTMMVGCLTPPVPDVPSVLSFEGDDSLSKTQPVIVTDSGQVLFWYGIMKPEETTLKQNYELLGRGNDVFPIHYRSTVELSSGPLEGEIDGFGFLEERKIGLFRKKKLCVAVTR